MLPYSAYEVFHLRQIWDKYYVKIKENAGGSDKIRKWFYIGQILLSDYRGVYELERMALAYGHFDCLSGEWK